MVQVALGHDFLITLRHSEQVKVSRLWKVTAITNTFPLSSWQIGEGQVSGLTTGGTGRSRTRFLDHSAALRTGEGE